MTLKEIFITISTIIDDKLKTPSGKLTLVILNCIILGGATVHSWNVSTNLDVAVIDRDIYKRKEDSIQTVLNTYIATEKQRCNDNLEKGALLQKLGDAGDWTKVITASGVEGYCMTLFLAIVGE